MRHGYFLFRFGFLICLIGHALQIHVMGTSKGKRLFETVHLFLDILFIGLKQLHRRMPSS